MKGLLLFIAGLLLGANALYFWTTRNCPRTVASTPAPVVSQASPEANVASGTVAIPPAVHAGGAPSPPSAIQAPPAAVKGDALFNLLLPVAGIMPSQLQDTFNDRRGSDRIHEALDILAPRGTEVYAAADGTVAKLFDSKAGGTTLYQFEPSGQYALYYAHLDRYAPGIAEGMALKRGQLLGYVGSTGNADPSAPHLHFAIFRLGPDRKWWQGTPVDPYPLLAPPG